MSGRRRQAVVQGRLSISNSIRGQEGWEAGKLAIPAVVDDRQVSTDAAAKRAHNNSCLYPIPRTQRMLDLALQQSGDLIPDPNLPTAAVRDGPVAARALHAQAASGSPAVEGCGEGDTSLLQCVAPAPCKAHALALCVHYIQGGPTQVSSSFLSASLPLPQLLLNCLQLPRTCAMRPIGCGPTIHASACLAAHRHQAALGSVNPTPTPH